MTKDEAMKMALEELETQVEHHSGAYLAIEALRQALAEPSKWVHLLTDEKADIRNSVDYSQFMSAEEYACKVQDATEAKLKELNHD